jgi:hypothetical protein
MGSAEHYRPGALGPFPDTRSSSGADVWAEISVGPARPSRRAESCQLAGGQLDGTVSCLAILSIAAKGVVRLSQGWSNARMSP